MLNNSHPNFQYLVELKLQKNNVVLQSLKIHILYGPISSLAAKVSVDQNITGLILNTNTSLTCSFTNNVDEQITKVEFFAKNKTDDFEDINKPIVIFTPDKPAKLHSTGKYLNGRVTLTKLTSTSTYATLTFHVLKCEDEKDYKCKCYYDDWEGAALPTETSPPTRISVQATSSKPERVSITIVASPTTEMQGFSTSIDYNSLSTKKGDILTISTSPIDTVTTTQSTSKLPFVFREEDTVMFSCIGDIGNPPGKLVWQKTFPQGKPSITYSNETTDIEEIPGKCSFKGISHLTVKIYVEDIHAKIRCFEESQVNVPGMYLETGPFDVHFQVNHVDIIKQPNQQQYDQRTDNITLTCKGNGNPQPTYVWFENGKDNSTLSNKSVYIIENVIRNNSGVYICEVNNIIGDINYRKSNSVEIYIVHEDELPLSPDSAVWNIFKEIVIPVICAVLSIVTLVAVMKYCYNRPKRKVNDESYSRKFSFDGITFNPEYTSIILTNNTTAGVNNGMDNNKSKNKQEDLIKTVDLIPNLQTTSFSTPVYAVPSDALKAQNATCKIPPGMTSFKDQENI
ncbi:ALCAM [Mytilus coruscus]|uniref:ALCAM n=1 Tax=Mytilus coruscus TaxID=42192 RepID=A0A6J8EX31_MYTCO|nr:ALCAM [Mytilus coruscus]